MLLTWENTINLRRVSSLEAAGKHFIFSGFSECDSASLLRSWVNTGEKSARVFPGQISIATDRFALAAVLSRGRQSALNPSPAVCAIRRIYQVSNRRQLKSIYRKTYPLYLISSRRKSAVLIYIIGLYWIKQVKPRQRAGHELTVFTLVRLTQIMC